MNPMRTTLFGGAVIALAALASFPVVAADSISAAATADNAAAAMPIVVAQMSPTPAVAARPVAPYDAFPAYQRGVRQAASEGNEALRRYIWRTRMIYDFRYDDFAT